MKKYNIYKINSEYYTKVIFDNEKEVYLERIQDISKQFYLPKNSIFTSSDELINIIEFDRKNFKNKKPILKNYELFEINIEDAQYAYLNMKVIKNYITMQFHIAITFNDILKTHKKYSWLLDKINYAKLKAISK